MDQDFWLKALNFHGSLLLQSILGEPPEPKSEPEADKYVMCNFISQRKDLLFKRSEELPGSFPEHDVPIIPIEIFRDASLEERRDLFYTSLDRGHILILRVINDTLPESFKLLVLCKEENHMKLDDLSIIMYLPKLPAELELAGGKLESNDLIRAAVWSCSIDERKLFVTLDSNILEDEASKVHLGKITEKDLPFYIGDVDLGPSYCEYLGETNYLYKPDWVDDLQKDLCLKKDYLYSFFECLDGKEYNRSVYASELRKKQILHISNENYLKALQHYEEGRFPEAFTYFNKALEVHPKNLEALVARGTLYANTNDVKKAFIDIEAALNIDPKHEKACKQMSVLLVSVARKHLESKDLLRAKDSLVAALFVDSNNKDAIAAYEEFKKLYNEKLESIDKSAKTSESKKKDRIGSCSSDKSDSSSSKKGDSKEDSDVPKQNFDLEAATRKFLFSMQKKRQDGEKDKKSHHHHHHKSQSKSPLSKVSP